MGRFFAESVLGEGPEGVSVGMTIYTYTKMFVNSDVSREMKMVARM